MNKKCSPHVRLALEAINQFVLSDKIIQVPESTCVELTDRAAGAFVSLHKFGKLRGCIGTIMPTETCIAKEIIQNAVSACSRDGRFSPVEAHELEDLECSVDVLEPAEPVTDLKDLDPKTYGIIVQKNNKRGLLLPDLDGVDTVGQQISIALQKAGIAPEEDYQLMRFKVTRFY